MKRSTFAMSVLLVTLLISLAIFNKQKLNFDQSVNMIIGDVSIIETLGITPTKETNEELRISTHLEYVENLLRSRNVSGLTPEQKENRSTLLDLLHDYWTNGIFPRNYDHPDKRVPCFIDKDGRICAVGYLVEQTAGRAVAEDINARYKYDYLLAMHDPVLDSWIASSGLSKEECAMIQPSYGSFPVPVYTDTYVSPGYGITTSLVSGLNVSLVAVNSIQLAKGTHRKTVPILGLITGAGQITMGALNYPDKETNYWGETYVNPEQRNLSLMNIGLGASTMIMSSWNLIANRKPKDKSLAWNVYGFPSEKRQLGIGFSLRKKL